MHTQSSLLLLFVTMIFMVIRIDAAPTLDRLGWTREQLLGKDLDESGRNPSWILDFYGSDEYLNQGDKIVFKKPLTNAVIGPRLSHEGLYNKGIYALNADYKGSIPESETHLKSEVIVKVMEDTGNNALGEVRALKDVGLYIDSGLIIIDKEQQPVILMKKVPGVSLQEIVQYRDASSKEEVDAWIAQMEPLVQQLVVSWALSDHRLLHADLNVCNIHIGGKRTQQGISFDEPITEVNLLDFGYPGIFKVSETVTKEQVQTWFKAQWKSRTSNSAKPGFCTIL
ncbi:hypothetical protein DFJ43DRAFT_205487 [Lentinula guzmanii]|uniref:Protein kinase domain-containing protein n=1 Tax=Lentinula guzmanii TaxID=2804957 RepID=A0AA38JK96_9AGAR|nr:hypothetical protein DFJ43DRAFT_205487 [Lentinula guzmanii]